MKITLNGNEPEILYTALDYYLKELVQDVQDADNGKGWPEINEEISTVKSLKERLCGI